MGQLGFTIIITVSVFFFILGVFLFKDLSKYYLLETKKYVNLFRIKNNNIGEYLVTLFVASFTGFIAFLIYKTIIAIAAYTLSGDLIEFFILDRGVFSNKVALQSPYLTKNIIFGLLITPMAQFFSVWFMIKTIRLFMNEVNDKANDTIYDASSLVYFSTISIITFVIIELFAYSQAITFVSTITNSILLIGAKLSYILFFFSLLHIELIKNDEYYNEIHKQWFFNGFEKKLIFNKSILIFSSIIIAIILNFPLYTGIQFTDNNWAIITKLILVGILFYMILKKVFARGFNFIGVYMIDDSRNLKISKLSFCDKINKKLYLYVFITITLILLLSNYKALFFLSFFLVILGCLMFFSIIIFYGIGTIISKLRLKIYYLRDMMSSLGKAILPVLLFFSFTFLLFNLFPKKLKIENHINYQRSILDKKRNILYLENIDNKNKIIPVDFKELPEFFIKALIVKEDRGVLNQDNFLFNIWNWHGVSFTGRSNINQQLIKNLAFDNTYPKEFQRKFSEFLASYQLSLNLTPEEILNYYVNLVPFNGGVGHKGIEMASYYTFGRNLNKLNELEMMYLLFTLQRGSTFKLNNDKYISYKDAYLYSDEIKERLLLIAKLWFENDYISKKEFSKLKRSDLTFINRPFKPNNSTATNSFFKKIIKEKDNLSVVFISSISIENQLKIQSALNKFNQIFSIHKYKDGNKLYTSAIVVDVESGSILAQYGGDGESNLLNFGEGHPIASLIKPFVLLEILEEGHEVFLYDGKLNDRRLIHNYDNIYTNKYLNMGQILGPSKNAPMGNIFEIIPPIPLFINVESKFTQMGIKSDLSINLSEKNKNDEYTVNYPIGSRRMTIYDIAQVYQTLFNHGKYIELNTITESFNPFWLSKKKYPINSKIIYDNQNTDKVLDALKLTLEPGGTAFNLNKYLPKNVQFMAKTGTSAKYRHGYTVLSDGKILVVSWVSYGKKIGANLIFNQTEIPNKSGGNSAGILGALIFNEFYNVSIQ